MVEREIICCGARGWVKTIAWIQIISNCIGTAACLILILFVVIPQNYNARYAYVDGYPVMITLGSFNIAVVGIVCGVFLLWGTNQNNTKYIKRWMIYQIVSLILYGNVILAGAILGLWLLVIFIIPLLYTVYGIWIVCVFMVEIQSPSNGGSGQQALAQAMPSRREINSQPESGPPPPYNPKMTQQV